MDYTGNDHDEQHDDISDVIDWVCSQNDPELTALMNRGQWRELATIFRRRFNSAACEALS